MTFAVTNGPASIHGGNQLTFTGAGSVTITASQSGSANYHDATPVARNFNVTKASTTVTLRELHQVADGTPRVVTVTTVPPGLNVAITYAGDPDAPTAIGSYAIIATINDPLYQGSANGTLVVDDPAAMTRIEGGQLPAVSALGALDVPTYQTARYEVTRGFWNTVRDWAIANGYDLAAIGEGSVDDHPVHSLNWYDAIKWCNARTEWENAIFGRSLAPVYRIGTAVFKTGEPDPTTVLVDERTSGYRLPTAMEWEFAARGGTSSTGKLIQGATIPTSSRGTRATPPERSLVFPADAVPGPPDAKPPTNSAFTTSAATSPNGRSSRIPRLPRRDTFSADPGMPLRARVPSEPSTAALRQADSTRTAFVSPAPSRPPWPGLSTTRA